MVASAPSTARTAWTRWASTSSSLPAAAAGEEMDAAASLPARWSMPREEGASGSVGFGAGLGRVGRLGE